MRPGQCWVQGQDAQGLAQHAGAQAQHANLYIPVAVVDHPQVDVHPGGDPDQTLDHGCSVQVLIPS